MMQSFARQSSSTKSETLYNYVLVFKLISITVMEWGVVRNSSG